MAARLQAAGIEVKINQQSYPNGRVVCAIVTMYSAPVESYGREKRNRYQNVRANSVSACHLTIPPLELISLARLSTGLLPGDFGAFFASFRETNRDRLLAASHHSAFSVFAGMERAALFFMYCSLDALTRRFAIFSHFTSRRILTDCKPQNAPMRSMNHLTWQDNSMHSNQNYWLGGLCSAISKTRASPTSTYVYDEWEFVART
jgi:hypothetical protein